METIYFDIRKFRLLPSNPMWLNKTKMWNHFNDVLVEEGIQPYIDIQNRVLRERIDLFGSWQFLLRVLGYILLGASILSFLFSLFILGISLLVPSFIAIFHERVWFKNKLDFMIRGYLMNLDLNKDIALINECREDLIKERENSK